MFAEKRVKLPAAAARLAKGVLVVCFWLGAALRSHAARALEAQGLALARVRSGPLPGWRAQRGAVALLGRWKSRAHPNHQRFHSGDARFEGQDFATDAAASG